MPNAEVTTDQPVNPGQLSAELDGAALKVVGPDADGVTIVRALEPDDGEPVSRRLLEQAVAAHEADPDWTDPDAPPPRDPAVRVAAIDRLAELRQAVVDGASLSVTDVVEVVELALRAGAL